KERVRVPGLLGAGPKLKQRRQQRSHGKVFTIRDRRRRKRGGIQRLPLSRQLASVPRPIPFAAPVFLRVKKADDESHGEQSEEITPAPDQPGQSAHAVSFAFRIHAFVGRRAPTYLTWTKVRVFRSVGRAADGKYESLGGCMLRLV